jgi:hypothetical protein
MTAKPKVGAQLGFAITLIVFAIWGLSRAHVALRQQTISWDGGRGANITWMDPWQAILAFGLFGLLGSYCLLDAIRKRRR